MFTSKARYALLQHNFDEARRLHHGEVTRLETALAAANAQLTAEREDKRNLLEKYHSLRPTHSDSVPPITVPAMPDVFGPLTRAALADASVGQSGPVIRAMRAKAQTIWMENRDKPSCDETVAIAVRNGEASRA